MARNVVLALGAARGEGRLARARERGGAAASERSPAAQPATHQTDLLGWGWWVEQALLPAIAPRLGWTLLYIPWTRAAGSHVRVYCGLRCARRR